MGKEKHTVAEILENSQKTFIERSEIYGNAYENIGKMMVATFPEGLELNTEKDFNRFYALIMSVAKLNRYASNMKNGGHQDSAHDCIVYSAMLESFTEEK